jgi:uncharacterized membrane protein
MHDAIFFLGRFHVLVLHLPIGIAIAAVAADWLSRRPRYRTLSAAAPFLWGATALTAVVTVALGYMHFAEGGFDGPSARAHRAYGTAVAIVSLVVWWASTRSRPIYAKARVAAGVVVLALVTLTGHYGGNLTHGSSYLVEYAPQPVRALAGLGPRRPPVTSLDDADPYHDLVEPMLRARCGSCHNAAKRNGGFSLATYESTLAGGDTGGAIVPGNLEFSEAFRRVSLSPDDEAFMPAEGKTPLTADEIEILRWWIEAGAPSETTLGEVGAEPAIEPLLTAALGLDLTRSERPEIAEADPEIVAALTAAGFLARQVSRDDPRLVVSVYSPGTALALDQLAPVLAAGERIVDLDLQDSALEDAELERFGRLAALTRLRVSNNRISDSGIRHLAALPKLESLNLYGNPAVSDAALETLAGIASLRRLYLWQTSVSEQGLEWLRNRRPDLDVQGGAEAKLMLEAADPAAAASVD